MKVLVSTFLFALAWQSVRPQCADIINCNTCSNSAPSCSGCSSRNVLALDSLSCLPCGDFCNKCTANADKSVTCTDCFTGYYYDTDSSTCITCGDGCLECGMNTEGTLECLKCTEEGYVHNVDADGKPCASCPDNCQTCTMNEALTGTVCTKCYSFPGQDILGYFLTTADKSCKSCGTRASACGSDDGSGSAQITDCFSRYEVEAADKKKCIQCPSNCATCSGVDLNGKATCETCEADSGTFLVEGECLLCTDSFCNTCEDDATCRTCKEGYRVDAGSCTECPFSCEECSVNDDGNDVCAECEDYYGTKESSSVTCDKCTISNCIKCQMSGTGIHTCSECEEGYGINTINGKCELCGDGCKKCTYKAADPHFACTQCAEGYTDEPTFTLAQSNSTDPAICKACSSAKTRCTKCFGSNPTCTDCEDGYFWSAGSGDCEQDNVLNCETYNDDGSCKKCAAGYNGTACDQCTGTNCLTCTETLAYCDSCVQFSVPFDADGDGNTEQCKACGISNCEVCDISVDNATSIETILCTECRETYGPYDADTQSTTRGKSCRKCPTGCNTCTYDYTNRKTVCTSGQCASEYTDGESGECAQCPDNCNACSYADGTTSCQTGQCADRFALNTAGECEACPDFCQECTYDETSGVLCQTGKCDPGYGLISGGKCAACAGNCEVCSVKDSEAAPDTLTCDTCSDGYAKNEAVCGACSPNCMECSDNGGTMECDKCQDGYALDGTTKKCVKCMSNCESCVVAGGVLRCDDCANGYSLSVDNLSCLTCGVAAFDFCTMCSDVDAETNLAECMSCTSGYTLQDMNPAGPCIDVSSLDCPGYRVDYPSMCSSCVDGFTETDMGLCAITCYACGDFESGEYVPQESCQIPSSKNATAQTGFATREECTTGVCLAYYDNGNVITGCAPLTEDGRAPTCDDTRRTESCDTVPGSSRCEQCCTADDCNEFVTTMDGISGAGIPACSSFLVLLSVAVLAICGRS